MSEPEAADIPVAATVVIARDRPGGPEVLMIQRPDRGSFGGAWVFPGGKLEPADAGADEAARARSAGVRESAEETGLILAPDTLTPLSRWMPPVGVPWRIRTWFFLAADPGGLVQLAKDEAVAAVWLTPDEALGRHGRGEWVLYPPTWVTLDSLAEAGDVGALSATARSRGIQLFQTRAHPEPAGPLLLWDGDADYSAGADPAGRHRLDISALPWVYERAG